jgi:hypothetical protein
MTWPEIAMCSIGVVVAGFGVAYWLDGFVRRRTAAFIKAGEPAEDLLSTMRETGAAYGSQILPILGPSLFDRRARRLADFIILRAPPAVIAVDLWLTLVAHCGGRRRALWYGVRELWSHYVVIPWFAFYYREFKRCLHCGRGRKAHLSPDRTDGCDGWGGLG